MKIVKKNQIVILVIALMLVSAGYLSYTGSNKTNANVKETSGELVDETDIASIGDAKLVNANVEMVEEAAIVPNNEENIIENKSETETEVKTENIVVDTKATNANEVKDKDIKKTEEYFSSSRLNRETMYSQMIESYQKILESSNTNETQKAIAQTEIQNINNMKNKIMICENLIKTKGIENLVIFVNDTSVSVIVRADSLEQDKIAQIQNIISREMEVEINDIHISNK